MNIFLFCKYPRRGEVKTRLAASCGDDAALSLYERMLTTLLGNLAGEALTVFVHGCTQMQAEQWLPGYDVELQQGRGLGERLQQASEVHFARSREPLALIGADCPFLSKADFDQAAQRLSEADVVFGPAADGGYWLLALNSPVPALFREIDWGTSEVLQQSLERAEGAGLTSALLAVKNDMDFREDIPEQWIKDLENV